MNIPKTLLLMGLLIVVAAFLAISAYAADEADYVGNSQCKMCHNKADEGEQWKKWDSMAHRKAFETLKSAEALEVAKKLSLEKPPSEAPECLKCHVTAYNAETCATPTKIKMEDGVQCESCHGPASLHVKDGQKLRTGKGEGIDVSAHIKRGDEKLCKTCHNDKNPTWDPERYTLEDGTKAGFDFKQAWKQIDHSRPKKAETAE